MANRDNRSQNINEAIKGSTQMKLNRFIANKWVILVSVLFIDLILFLLMNYCLNLLYQIGQIVAQSREEMSMEITLNIDYGLNQVFYQGVLNKYPAIRFISILLLLFIDIRFVYKINVSFRDFNKNQKGAARWTTIEEIKKEYRAVPDKMEKVTDRFPNKGGFPICHYEGKWYIDDTPVNNIIIGITRSGKGEMLVFPMINIYSSAEKQSSLVISDPKLELAAASYDTLVARGYEVHILNLIDPINSMGFNPLTSITAAYKRGNIEEAQLLCSSLCYSIFNPDEADGDSQFWANTSTFCLSALILAHISDCLELDHKENEKAKSAYENRVLAFQSLPEEKQQEVIFIWKEIEEKKAMLKKASLTNFKELTEDIKRLEFQVKDYQNPKQSFMATSKHEKEINLNSVINTFSELARRKIDDNLTLLDVYFSSRPALDPAKALYSSVEVSGDRTKGSIFANTLSKLQIFTYDAIAKMTAESTVHLEDVGFGAKPVAIFLGIPDFDRSNHFIASVFIRQLYFALAKKCSLIPSGKCDREVINILDEFGNLPAIESMENIITVCLGRNIRYNLIIQSYSQIDKLYGESAATIIENCGNQLFILSNGNETAEQFSKLIGSETITNINRIGGKMSLNKSFTEMTEDKPLLNANELMELRPGECVVKRIMKRVDLKGKKIKPRPIFNQIETKTTYPYRYTYMKDFFPSNKTVAEVTTESRVHINLKERVFDWKNHMEHLNENSGVEFYEKSASQTLIFEKIKNCSVMEIDENALEDFYEILAVELKNRFGAIEVSLENMKDCTVNEVYSYLMAKSLKKLANKWFSLVTNGNMQSTKKETPEDSFSDENSKQNNSIDNNENLFEMIKNNSLNDFHNLDDLLSLIEKNINEQEILESGYEDVDDCAFMTVAELFGLILDDSLRKKCMLLLKNGMN